jgi:hypothetical protein
MDPSLKSAKRNYCEVGQNAWTAAAPCACGTTWRRFQAQRVERALVPRRRILSNAILANGLSAPIFDGSEDAECNAPPFCVVRALQPPLRRLERISRIVDAPR